MTYQAYFDQLHADFTLKGQEYLKAEKEVESHFGVFGDHSMIVNLLKAKGELDIANNKFYTFLHFAWKNKIDPNEEIVSGMNYFQAINN